MSPQPTPPNLDPQRIMFGGGPEVATSLAVEGEPGAVEPAEGAIVLTNLDGIEAPNAEPVRADGSFAIGSNGATTDELRLQVRAGTSRSEPLDIVRNGLVWDAAPRPLEGCFTADPPFEIDFGSVGDSRRERVTLRNDCPDAVELNVSLRMGSTAFAVEGTPTRIEPGERARFTVVATTPSGMLDEETLLVDVTSPLVDRRALTLFVRRD